MCGAPSPSIFKKSPDEGLGDARRSLPWRVPLLIVLGLAFTLLAIALSFKRGRLQFVPVYDDCTYFLSGLRYLHGLRDHGFGEVLALLRSEGMHAPFSTLLAAASYAVFGVRDSAPYLGNGLVILAFLFALHHYLKRLPLLPYLASLALFLALPFSSMAVAEFRPDLMWAILLGFGGMALITMPLHHVRARRLAVPGLFLALALLTKPSMFPISFGVYGFIFLGRSLHPLFLRRRFAWKRVAFEASWLALPALILASPYFIYYGNELISYFYRNAVGDQLSIWAHRRGLVETLGFYAWGGGAFSSLGLSVIPLALLSFAACLVFFRRSGRPARFALFLWIASVGVLYLVCTAAAIKSPFLGCGIYALSFMGCAWLLGRSFPHLSRVPRLTPKAKQAAFLAAALLGVALYRWPSYSDLREGTRRLHHEAATQATLQMIRHLEETKAVQAMPRRILFMEQLPVVQEVVAMWALRSHVKIDIQSGAFLNSAQAFSNIYPRHDWVVVPSPMEKPWPVQVPAAAQLGRFLEIMGSDRRYARRETLSTPMGQTVHIFSRKAGLTAQAALPRAFTKE